MTEHHPLVKVLFAEIPTGNVWPESRRALWLAAIAAAFDLVYGAGETVDMREVIVHATDSKQLLLQGETVIVETATEPNTEVAHKPSPKVEVVAPTAQSVAPARNVGGRPKTTGPARPDGIPTNLNMAFDAIDHHEGKASASQILAYVRRQYWSEAPSNWTASLYDHVTAKKLARDGINFIRPVEPKVEAKPSRVDVEKVPPLRPVSAPENRPVPEGGVKFEFNGKSAMLTKAGFRVAEALRRAMGKGHLDYSYLMQAGTAGQQRRAGLSEKVWCMEAIADIRPLLYPLGLEVIHSPDFGYSMRATAVA